jgi:hypothetical protein
MLAATIAKDEARRQADLYYGQTIAQANVLRARATPRRTTLKRAGLFG